MKTLLIIAALLLTSCSTYKIQKDCSKVEDKDGLFVCKTLKPWE